MPAHPIDRRAPKIAARQAGLVTRAQLLDQVVGADLDDDAARRAMRRRVAARRWAEPFPGIYALPGHRLDARRRVWLAILAAGPGAMASHATAAALHGFRDSHLGTAPVHVVVARHHHPRQLPERVVLHRSDARPAPVLVDGIPATGRPRTLFDLSSSTTPDRLRIVTMAALADRLVRRHQIEDTFLALARPGRNGTAAMRAVLLELERNRRVPTRSELEVVLRRLFVQVVGAEACAWDASLPGRPPLSGLLTDCLVEVLRLLGEADGREFHARVEAFDDDRARDRAALALGYPTVRYSHAHLTRSYRLALAELTLIAAERRRLLLPWAA